MLRNGLEDFTACSDLSMKLKNIVRLKVKAGTIDNLGYAMLIKELGNVEKERANVLRPRKDDTGNFFEEVLIEL